MSKEMEMVERRPSPRLTTVVMVEDTIRQGGRTWSSVAEIKRELPRQVNHYALMAVLEYLEKNGRISVALDGIRWTGGTEAKA